MKSVAEYMAELKELSISEQADFWVIVLEDGMDDAKETAFRFWLADSPDHRAAYHSSLDIWRLAGHAAAKKRSVTGKQSETMPAVSPPPQRFRVAQWMAAGIAVLVFSAFLYTSPIPQTETITTAQSGFIALPLKD